MSQAEYERPPPAKVAQGPSARDALLANASHQDDAEEEAPRRGYGRENREGGRYGNREEGREGGRYGNRDEGREGNDRGGYGGDRGGYGNRSEREGDFERAERPPRWNTSNDGENWRSMPRKTYSRDDYEDRKSSGGGRRWNNNGGRDERDGGQRGREDEGFRGGRGGGGGGFQNRREGDWDCPECGDLNFASRSRCRRCEASRPEDGEQGGSYRDEGRRDGGARRYNDGGYGGRRRGSDREEVSGPRHGDEHAENVERED